MNMKCLAALTLGLALSACGGSTPEDLAAQMEKALQSGDVDAVLALGDLQGAPPEALFF